MRAEVALSINVRQLRHHIGSFLAHPPHAMLFSAHSDWMLIGACNPMLCPIHVLRRARSRPSRPPPTRYRTMPCPCPVLCPYCACTVHLVPRGHGPQQLCAVTVCCDRVLLLPSYPRSNLNLKPAVPPRKRPQRWPWRKRCARQSRLPSRAACGPRPPASSRIRLPDTRPCSKEAG